MEAALAKVTFDLLLEIARVNPDLQKTIDEVLKGTAITGGCVAVGGLLAGKDGMLLGGILGILMTAATAKDFKPLPQIMQEMSKEDQQKLVETAQYVIMNQPIEIATMIVTNITSDAAKEFMKIVFQIVKNSKNSPN